MRAAFKRSFKKNPPKEYSHGVGSIEFNRDFLVVSYSGNMGSGIEKVNDMLKFFKAKGYVEHNKVKDYVNSYDTAEYGSPD